MKLSEAMRKGAEMTPQGMGRYWDEEGNTCAVGAALVGLLGKEIMQQNSHEVDVIGAFPILRPSRSLLHSEITFRNDTGMSREQIADWLEEQGL